MQRLKSVAYAAASHTHTRTDRARSADVCAGKQADATYIAPVPPTLPKQRINFALLCVRMNAHQCVGVCACLCECLCVCVSVCACWSHACASLSLTVCLSVCLCMCNAILAMAIARKHFVLPSAFVSSLPSRISLLSSYIFSAFTFCSLSYKS